MKTLEEYLELAAKAHGHLCAGQVLGVRMAMLGLRELGIDDPIAHRKRLITFVEIDRCAADAVSLVTGCRLGKRALKHVDYGKLAATFVDLATERAVRVTARESSKQRARSMFPDLEKGEGQRKAYAVMEERELFDWGPVRVHLKPEDLPGRSLSRVTCDVCGEGINDRREVVANGLTLCRACAGQSYYEKL